jgi:hypothetical protein
MLSVIGVQIYLQRNVFPTMNIVLSSHDDIKIEFSTCFAESNMMSRWSLNWKWKSLWTTVLSNKVTSYGLNNRGLVTGMPSLLTGLDPMWCSFNLLANSLRLFLTLLSQISWIISLLSLVSFRKRSSINVMDILIFRLFHTTRRNLSIWIER